MYKSNFNQISVNFLSLSYEEDLNNTLRSFWKTDSEIRVSDENGLFQYDKNCLTHLDSVARYNIGKCEVPILRQEEKWSFPNSYNVAFKKFKQRLRKRKKERERDLDLRKKYKDAINNYIEKVYAKKLRREEACKVSKRTWYLPHHLVFNKNKPDKFWIAFDTAAEINGNSLNKALLTSPDLLNSLVGVLQWFCDYRDAFSADIEAMYHKVRLNSNDADALRFLWLEDVISGEKPDTYQMLLQIFGRKKWSSESQHKQPMIMAANLIQQLLIFLHGWSSEICWNWRTSGINYKTIDRINANWCN